MERPMYIKRMRDLREDSDYSQAYVAERLGTSQTMYARYERGANELPIHHLITLSKYYGVSTDYLLGRKEDSHVRSFHACPPFGERLIFLLQENHCSQYKLCKDANISSSVLRHWLNGTHVPSLDNVVKLADFFGCSADYVLGREK